MAANKTVLVRGEFFKEEFTAAGTITPGHLLQIDSNGKVVVHASSGGNSYPLVALENDLVGDDIDDTYASGDRVQCAWLYPGCTINAKLADGQSVHKGDLLMSAGDGTLTEYVAQVDSAADVETIVPRKIFGIAREAVDMSGSSGVDPSGRILVTVL